MIQYDVILQLLKDVCVLTKHLKLGGAEGERIWKDAGKKEYDQNLFKFKSCFK